MKEVLKPAWFNTDMKVAREKVLEMTGGEVELGGDDDCWTYTGNRIHSSGFVFVYKNYKSAYGHREIVRQVGFNPEGRMLYHSCGNKLCLNPRHIGPRYHGEVVPRKHKKKPITYEAAKQIRELYASGVTQVALAKQFDCTQANISQIVRGVSWKKDSRNALSSDLIEQIRADRKSGMGYRELTKKYKLGYSKIYHAVNNVIYYYKKKMDDKPLFQSLEKKNEAE